MMNKNTTIGVIGLGYVGLPLMLRCAESGFSVIGFDIDANKIDQLNQGKSYIKHIDNDRITQIWQSQQYQTTTDFSRISEADILVLCVPTPLGHHREPDLSFVLNTINSLLPYLRQGQLISLESTTYPCKTEEELRPLIEQKGFKMVINRQFSTNNIPKIVGGSTPACLERGLEFYSSIVETVIPVTSTQVAEMTKILENIYRAVNIGLVNELKILADKMGIDIWEVVDAAATKPFGFTPFYPGPGLGGHCIPIDPFYLTWKAKEYGISTRFIELAGEINTFMPHWVVTKVMDALNNHGKALKDSKILVLGIAYKKNVDDSRESPAIELMHLLSKKGAIISYSDPFIPNFPKKRNYSFNLKSVEISPEILPSFDCILLATDHDAYDYEMIQQHSKLIVDTRGRYRKTYLNIVKS